MLKKSLTLLDRLSVKPAVLTPILGQPIPKGVTETIRAASLAQSQQNWSQARALWAEVTERQPKNINGWLQLGNMHNELGEHEAAIAAFETARSIDPQAAEPVAGIAGVRERMAAWAAALATWNSAIALLRASDRTSRRTDPEHLARALIHAARSAAMIGQRDRARELLREGPRLVPGFADLPEHMLVRAQILRDGNPAEALALLRRHLQAAPEDDAARFEFGSIALDHGEAAEAAEIVEAAIVRRPADISFLWLLADLRDRLRDWGAVRQVSEQMAALDPGGRRYLERALDAALRMQDLVSARRLARAMVRATPGEFMALHLLAMAYDTAAEHEHARLLFRFLRRKWPHSLWHAAKVVILTAERFSLPDADRLLRADIERSGRHIDLDRAYYDAAFRSGNHAETRRRLEWFLTQHPEDEAARLFLGYVIANASGLGEAEQHFAAIATNTFQSKGALIGLAHMAMRRRDAHAVHERWANVVGLYPDDTIGRVEYARSAYDIRDVELAVQICQEQLRRMPNDVTMGEFYAWLLVATGRFEDAWTYLRTLGRHTGASWAVLELSLQTAAETDRLSTEITRLLSFMPHGGTKADARRFYHAIRQLWSARRQDLLPLLVRRSAIDPQHLAWLAPYLRRMPTEATQQHGPALATPTRARVDAAWNRAHGLVRGDTAATLAAASDADIATLLNQPPSAFPTVHIVNKFEQPRGGSELHAIDLAERLGRHARVELWAPEMPHPHFSQTKLVQAIEPGQGRVPHGGVLVMIGVYFEIASWIRRARPRRVIFLYNTFEAPLLFERIKEVYDQTGIRPEIIYCSDMMRQEVDLPGIFEPSPVDIEAFRPRTRPRPPGHRFTVGRHSRDVIEKHHAQDWKAYEAVAASGGRSLLLGGTCMEQVFPPLDSIEFLSARNDRIVDFLQDLDCYYYNTSTWIEPWGRVVIEAMACGLPVLVSDSGGYAQAVEHGRNGLVFRDIDEAVAMMRELAADPALRQRLGEQARRDVEAMLGAAALARLVAFYLLPG